MKKNDWSILISVLLYSILFYEQTAGINFFIFNAALVSLLIYRNSKLLSNKVWLSVAASALISSFAIAMYGSALAIWANIFSLFILSTLSIEPGTSFLTSILMSVISFSTSCVFMFLDWVKRKKEDAGDVYRRPFYVKLFLIVIPFLIAVLFFFFYQSANPLFYDFTKDINLDFISIAWLFFTYSGLLLMYGFFHNRNLKGISDVDLNAALNLTPELAARKNFLNDLMRLDTEAISGVILFSMLNALLLLLNVLDLHYLWFDGTLPVGMKPKEFVHDGIGTLITSIVIAIIIILFYFRGTLNFYKQNKWLRAMAYIWIVQNAFMIFSSAYRNHMYISESGLSYKKIGVYVYLILVLIGLITTFVKVWKVKTNWYLFRVNAAIYFYILVFSSVFNWDVLITDFNIKKFTNEKKELEKYLLLDLSYKNLPQLLALPDSVKNKDDFKARDYYYSLRGVYFYGFKTGLDRKLYEFMDAYNRLEWPSYCFEKERVYKELMNQRNTITDLNFENYYLQTLKPLEAFNNLRTLNINDCSLQQLPELKMFPRLEKLSIRSNQLDTIKGFPAFVELRELDLAGNNISDITPLRALHAMETLDLSGRNPIKSFAPLLGMPHLRHLIIGEITEEGLEALKRTFPNVKIDANVITIPNVR